MTDTYYERNKEKVLENQKKYHAEHREERIKYCREYRKKNKEELNAKRRTPAGRHKSRIYSWHQKGISDEEIEIALSCLPETMECEHCLVIADGTGTSERLHLDHDHDTGKFRAWLCNECNTMLGKHEKRITKGLPPHPLHVKCGIPELLAKLKARGND